MNKIPDDVMEALPKHLEAMRKKLDLVHKRVTELKADDEIAFAAKQALIKEFPEYDENWLDELLSEYFPTEIEGSA